MTEAMRYPPTEAAAALGIGRSKLYELLQTGVLESVYIVPTGTGRRADRLVRRLRGAAVDGRPVVGRD